MMGGKTELIEVEMKEVESKDAFSRVKLGKPHLDPC
jgi:hypothetical protein